MHDDVPRRSFLRVVAVTTTSVLVGTALPASARASARRGSTSPSPDGIVRLGRAYLRGHPAERDLATLRELVPQLDPARPARGQLPAIAPAAADDFAAGRSVVVDGWLLAATEARAAAAVALGA